MSRDSCGRYFGLTFRLLKRSSKDLGGGFKDFLFSPLVGEIFQFD